jgi:hypothetical protein
VVKGIVGDVNVKGHINILGFVLGEEPWQEIWQWLNLQCLTFQQLGLADNTPDSIVWEVCQREELILITDNRNEDGPDSLETTIRIHNSATSLPVFTLSNATRFLDSPAYRQQVAQKLLQYLLEIDAYRGTGRLYLP